MTYIPSDVAAGRVSHGLPKGAVGHDRLSRRAFFDRSDHMTKLAAHASRVHVCYIFGSRLADATSLCNPRVVGALPTSLDASPNHPARTSLRPH